MYMRYLANLLRFNKKSIQKVWRLLLLLITRCGCDEKFFTKNDRLWLNLELKYFRNFWCLFLNNLMSSIKTVHTSTSKLPQISLNASQIHVKHKLIFFLSFSICEIQSRILSEIAANAQKRNLKNFKFFFGSTEEEEKKLIKNSAFEFSFFFCYY